ncbi:hypothetical protein ACOMHN_039774 [Nucella lapillus]
MSVLRRNVTVVSGQTAVLPCSVDFLGTYKLKPRATWPQPWSSRCRTVGRHSVRTGRHSVFGLLAAPLSIPGMFWSGLSG